MNNMPKVKRWDPKYINEDYVIQVKLDGVQAIFDGVNWTSRAGKPLYNLPKTVPAGIYEYFNTDWNTSVSDVRTQSQIFINEDNLYRIISPFDHRLFVNVGRFTIDYLDRTLAKVIRDGYEGLILRNSNHIFKLKKSYTADVRVLHATEGNGKNKGKLGYFTTLYGNVGTGFTDEMRLKFWQDRKNLEGAIIEISYMEMTKSNKLRQPVFNRLRTDKTTESFE